MRCPRLLSLVFWLALAVMGSGQQTSSSTGGFTRARGVPTNQPAISLAQAPVASGGTEAAAAPRTAAPLTPIGVAEGRPSLGRITAGPGVLPSDAGQIWREYDLSPYTSRIKNTEKPEQAVVDWILRETGTDLWFTSPVGMLSVDKSTLRVYHTPQVHEMVKGIYDRLLSNSAVSNRLGIRIITVNSPNWRTRALPIMKSIEVKSTGVDAWLMTRENAGLLLNELRGRADAKEHSSGVLDLVNGQTSPLGLTRPKTYLRGIRPRPDTLPSFEPQMATIDEGYSLSLSSLTSIDGSYIDLVVKCNIDQVERFIDVPLDIPTPIGQTQRISLQVPQMVSWRLHERFRWPGDHVLLLSCGVVATPDGNNAARPLFGLMGSSRADALLFIEPLYGQVAGPLPDPRSLNLPNAPFAQGNPLGTPPPLPNWNPAAIQPRFLATPLLPPSSHSSLR